MTHGPNSAERDHAKIAREFQRGVLEGNIPACRWIKLACERNARDHERARRGWVWRFDEDKARRICEFVELLPHIKGRWQTREIKLEPWQSFILACIFGWVDHDGYRRFRNALIVIPRKNGKTLIAAAVALYLLALDKEPGAEVYSAATTRDQAKISWELAKKMVERTPEFRDRYGIAPLAHSIAIESDAAWFKPLSRDSDSLEGLNPHGVVIDELHAHKTREVFDVMDEAEGARSQPLKFIISTEGDNPVGVFADQVNYLQQILLGNHEDDTYFGAVWTVDPEDEWTEEAAWAKANPNLYVRDGRGQPALLRSLQARVNRARRDPASQASFKTKRLDIRVGAADAYFNLLAWQQLCRVDGLRIEDFAGARCIMTVDLASKSDLAARVTVFRGDGTRGKPGEYYVFGRYYLPGDALQEGSPNYDFYRGWKEEGRLTFTDGPRTDYAFIEEHLKADAAIYHPECVGIDPNYNGEQFRQNMDAAGLPVIEIPHNIARFSEPMKDLASLILAGKVHHDGDPVLAWAVGNVVAKEDAKGNVYPKKSRPENKIDPAVMLIANMSEWLHMETPAISVYETSAVI